MLTVLRWTIRLLGIAVVVLATQFLLAEPSRDLLAQPLRVQVAVVALGVMIAGVLFGLRFERGGALLIFLGYIAFAIADPAVLHMPGFLFFPLMGVLYALDCRLHRHRRRACEPGGQRHIPA